MALQAIRSKKAGARRSPRNAPKKRAAGADADDEEEDCSRPRRSPRKVKKAGQGSDDDDVGESSKPNEVGVAATPRGRSRKKKSPIRSTRRPVTGPVKKRVVPDFNLTSGLDDAMPDGARVS